MMIQLNNVNSTGQRNIFETNFLYTERGIHESSVPVLVITNV